MLEHGGQLNRIAKQFSLDNKNWLDLSTGISPFSYPIPPIPDEVWRNLPQQKNSFIKAANFYYKSTNLMATNGSQSIIQVLPRLWVKLSMVEKQLFKPENSRVLLPKVGYKEHQKAWQSQGFKIVLYDKLPCIDDIQFGDILVVINPNNPSAELIEVNRLVKLKEKIQKEQGWLVVDEAFIDVCSEKTSLIALTHEPGIFVLRSFGKFFGLAGIRLGFVSCSVSNLALLKEFTGEWQINGPAMYIAEKAFLDTEWQDIQRTRLSQHTIGLLNLLSGYFELSELSSTNLFVRVITPKAVEIYQQLCLNKVYVRLCDDHESLRFGIPNQIGLTRLSQVLRIHCVFAGKTVSLS